MVTVCIGVWQVARLTIVASDDKAIGLNNKNQNLVKLSNIEIQNQNNQKQNRATAYSLFWIIIVGL